MDIRDDIVDLMSKCVRCGACREVCPSLRHGGCDPMAVMAGEDGNILDCIGCGGCTRVCNNTDPTFVMMYMRSKAKGSVLSELYKETGFVMSKSDLSRSELPPVWGGDNYLMSGCTVEAKAPFLKYAATVALRNLDEMCMELPVNSCCTYPLPFRQLTNDERNGYKRKIGNSSGGKKIITICPGCDAELRKSGISAVNFVNLAAAHLDRVPVFKDGGLKVAIEPGCHYDDIYDDLVKVVEATGVEHIGNKFGCCGKSIPKVSEGLMKERQEEISGADAVVVACPMCFHMYDSVPNGMPVIHLVELLSMAVGDWSTLKYHRNKLVL